MFFYRISFLFLYLALHSAVIAQQNPVLKDTFFLAKKKGLIGRFGKIISVNTPEIKPEKVANQYLRFKGKIIRNVDLVRLGFENNINDTNVVKNNFGIRIARLFHKNSKERTISRNLFFASGDKLYPYLLADNERYLRELVYVQDARILVDFAENSTDSVDVIVLTRDVFSMGGRLDISSTSKVQAEWKEENFNGSGSRVMIGGFYEKGRIPKKGFSAEIVNRNIGGRFIDWTLGFQNYRPAFNSGRKEETYIYTKLEKPLVTPFIPSTGAIEAAFYRTSNAYLSDSVYTQNYRYEYYNLDGWMGYSLDSKRMIYANKEIGKHRFIALRAFNQRFIKVPGKYKSGFNYAYADFTGALASINIFRQTFYRTNFIYGFGRGEDIPEGFIIGLTGGFVNKQGNKRPYGGIYFQFAKYNKRGFYSNFTFRAGGYYNKKRFEDIDLLLNVEHFTRLSKINANWYRRIFISSGITAQINPFLNTPLFLNSTYGLPYFDNGMVNADLRATIKAESVFFNMHKILGFRLAPFLFVDGSLLKPLKKGLGKSELYSAVGGGIRTRNENFVFGTIELKGYYFPRTNGNMNPWKIGMNSNLRFRYKSTFISRPDFIVAN